jgi:hypothetical protein
LEGLLGLVNGAATLYTCIQSVINMTWLLFSFSDWPIILISPGGLLLVVSPPTCCASFSFVGGVENK